MVVAAAEPATVASSRAIRTIVACFTAGRYPWPRASRKDIFWIDAGSTARVAKAHGGTRHATVCPPPLAARERVAGCRPRHSGGCGPARQQPRFGDARRRLFA